MRKITQSVIALGIIACSTAPGMGSTSRPASPVQAPAAASQPAPTDSIAEYLLTSAATDFHDHSSPPPARFREVRVGHFMNARGEVHYVLCGEFLPRQAAADVWTPFATIRTSHYEQWLGPQATAYCSGPSLAWDTAGDLSASLQSRLDALR